jgi:hypothetical protein
MDFLLEYFLHIWHTDWCLQKGHTVGLTGLMQSTNAWALEEQIWFNILSSVSHQMLQRETVNQKFIGLLISYFMACHQTRPVTLTFLLLFSTESALLQAAFVGSCFSLLSHWGSSQSAL